MRRIIKQHRASLKVEKVNFYFRCTNKENGQHLGLSSKNLKQYESTVLTST